MSIYNYNVKVSETAPAEIGGLWIKDSRADKPINTSFDTFNYFHDWWTIGAQELTYPLGDGQLFEIDGKKTLVSLGVGQTRKIIYANLDDQTVTFADPPATIDRSQLSEGDLAYYNSLEEYAKGLCDPFYTNSVPGNNPRVSYKISDTEMLIFNVESDVLTGVFKYNIITHECSHLKQFCVSGNEWDPTNMYREVEIGGTTYTLIQAFPYVNMYAPLGSGSAGMEMWGITPEYVNGKFIFITQSTSVNAQTLGIIRFIYDMNNNTLQFVEDYATKQYVNGSWDTLPALSDYSLMPMIGKSVYYNNTIYQYVALSDQNMDYYDCVIKATINNSDVSQETKQVIYLNKLSFASETEKQLFMIYALAGTGFIKGSTVNFLYDKSFIVIDTTDDTVSRGFISFEHPLIDINIALEQYTHTDLLTPQVFLLDEDTQDYIFSTTVGGIAGSGGPIPTYKLMRMSFASDTTGLEDSILICSNASGIMAPILSQYSDPANKIDYPISQIVYVDENGNLENLDAAYAQIGASEWTDL